MLDRRVLCFAAIMSGTDHSPGSGAWLPLQPRMCGFFGGIMNKSLNRAATIVSTVMIALVVICGGAGLWASRAQTLALRQQGAAAGLARNHMNADMMHDAIRADVLAVLAARNPE